MAVTISETWYYRVTRIIVSTPGLEPARSSTMKNFFALVSRLAALFCLVFCQTGALSSEKHVEYMQVPVLYATTRAPESTIRHYGPARDFSQVDHGIEYGVVTVTIPTTHSIDQELRDLGCNLSTKKQTKFSSVEKLQHETDFVDKLIALENRKPSEVCLFVHGYNNSFVGAAGSAAQLQIALKEPVILFSWPSQSKIGAYVVDECNAEWSLRPFQLLMQSVEKAVEPSSMITVSHSMGNRLINWYMQSRSDKNDGKPIHYKEIVLTSPDVDRGTFKNYFYKIADNADRVRLYCSCRDIPLRLSKALHGNGRAGSAAVEAELKWQVPSNLPRTQVVDFSAVDSGWLGHSIQYDIISSMHKNNSAGDTLRMVEDPAYKGNYVRIEK
jgi:esterase/lipase superfamily enzyme